MTLKRLGNKSKLIFAVIGFSLFASKSLAADQRNCGETLEVLQNISEEADYQINGADGKPVSVYGGSMRNLIQGEYRNSDGKASFIVYEHKSSDRSEGKGLYLTVKSKNKECVTTYPIGFCLKQPKLVKDKSNRANKYISTMEIWADGGWANGWAHLTLESESSGKYRGFVLQNKKYFEDFVGEYTKITPSAKMNIRRYLDLKECR